MRVRLRVKVSGSESESKRKSEKGDNRAGQSKHHKKKECERKGGIPMGSLPSLWEWVMGSGSEHP